MIFYFYDSAEENCGGENADVAYVAYLSCINPTAPWLTPSKSDLGVLAIGDPVSHFVLSFLCMDYGGWAIEELTELSSKKRI